MNCFEARNDFVGFWRRMLAGERRQELMAHLSECARCDRSFRSFALSAPVLYSNSEPERRGGSRATVLHPVRMRGARVERNLSGGRRVSGWSSGALAVLVAAAAAAAAYVAVTPRVTFEDAIAADNSSPSVASYNSTDNAFGQELLGQDSGIQDPNVQDASFEQ
jgi:hypothetical protein